MGLAAILLVNDEKGIRDLVREMLESKGYPVLEAKDGAHALEISERYEGPIHLVVTDVEMPEMSGRDLAEHLTRQRPEMKVIYMSGTAKDALDWGRARSFSASPSRWIPWRLP